MTRALSLRHIASIGATLWVFAPTVMAQSDAETLADLRACGAVERDGARLACFDGVLAAERAVATERAAAPERAAEPERAAPAERAAAAERNAAAAPNAVRERTAAEPAVAAGLAGGDRRRSSGPGAESPARTVTIVEVNDDLPGAARFTADTGRVFLQTSGGTPRGGYPDVPFEARIQDGVFGSLFLYVGERRRVRGIWAD